MRFYVLVEIVGENLKEEQLHGLTTDREVVRAWMRPSAVSTPVNRGYYASAEHASTQPLGAHMITEWWLIAERQENTGGLEDGR